MTEVITVPRPLLKKLYEHFDKIEEILATLEELSNKEVEEDKEGAWGVQEKRVRGRQ